MDPIESSSTALPEPHRAPGPADFRSLAPFVGPALIVLAASAMIGWTWNAWCDPVTDFGRELYVPWRLSEGDVLYRDIAYYNGPLSPYLNGTILRMLGVSMQSLVLANLLWWGLLVAMIYHLWTIIGDRFGATVACLVFVTVFSFNRLTVFGNYTYVAPYSHEITHGLVLGFAGLCCIERYLRRGGYRWIAATGLLLGAVFLTKVEVALAALVAVPLGAALGLYSRRANRSEMIRAGSIMFASALIAPVAAFLLLHLAMPASDAWRGVLGSWRFITDARIREMPFYENLLGIRHPGRNALSVATLLICYGLIMAPAVGIAFLSNTPRAARVGAGCAVLVTAGILGLLYRHLNWDRFFGGLSGVGILLVICFLVSVLRRRPDRRVVLGLTISIYAAMLLLKIFLNVVLYHYGFALAMPAMLLLSLVWVWHLPNQVKQWGGSPLVVRAAAIVVLGFIAFRHLERNAHYSRDETLAIGTGADLLYARNDLGSMNQMLGVLGRLPPGATVAALPEGAMLNYLARRSNPTGQLILLPGEFFMFGEDNVLNRFKSHPPDYIISTPTDVSVFGFRGLGIDYGQRTVEWIEHNYADVTPTQISRSDYPMLLLKRRSANGTASESP